MVFAVAGMVFGFVLGYMVASWDSRPRASTGTAPTASAPASGAPAAPAAATSALDPNEVKALESLAARDRSNLEARIELGNLLMDHSRHDEAARWYREALALNPGLPDILVDLGACLVNGGKAAEAAAVWEGLLKRFPDDPQLRGLRAQIERVKGRSASS